MLDIIKHTKDLCYSKTPANNPTKKLKVVVTKRDSTVSGHYWREEDIDCLQNMIDKKGADVMLSDSPQINSTLQSKLPLPSSLSKESSTAVVLPYLKSSLLTSLDQLCDDDYRVILNKKNIYVEKDDKLVLESDRNLIDGLWDIPIPYYDVYKKIVQTNNLIHPPTYMAMYMSKGQLSTSKPL